MKRLKQLRATWRLAPALGLAVLAGCDNATTEPSQSAVAQKAPSLFPVDCLSARPMPEVSDGMGMDDIQPTDFEVVNFPPVDAVVSDTGKTPDTSAKSESETGPLLSLESVDFPPVASSELPPINSQVPTENRWDSQPQIAKSE
ncbi:MAG: hypothetical protein SGJ20_02895, partial [Planctomycetota bacterium]|nr:hypothetical protein [Planctomycetota bacterium]